MRKSVLTLLLFLLLSLVSAYAGENTATVRDIRVVRDNGFVRIEITLSQPVNPVVKTAEEPARLVLVLPGTLSDARQKRIPVGAAGVKGVRMGLHSNQPPETDVVVDLEVGQSHSHALNVQGNKITLAVMAETARARPNVPAAGGSVSPLVGIFQKRAPAPAGQQESAPVRATSAPAASSPVATTQSQNVSTATATPPQTPAVRPPASQVVSDAQVSTATFPDVQPAPVANTASAPVQAQPQPKSAEQPSDLMARNRSTVESANVAPPALSMQLADSDLRIAFNIKYVAEGAAYLDGGRSSGLTEGMKLEVREVSKAPAGPTGASTPKGTANPQAEAIQRVVAELEVISVAETSAVTEVKTKTRDIQKGDVAYLSAADQAAVVQQRTLSSTRKYPQVVTFTEGDPLEEEAHAEVPRPPLPEVNRARGRIGFSYGGINSGNGLSSTQIGMVLRADVTRIGGTYWNLSGFWRGNLQQQSSNVQPTLQDLINRTYTLSMNYDNPNSRWVAGFGRLYLPWAPSLDTIDGGYIGRRIAPGVTAGVFGGSTPDPTSWSYTPGRRMAGSFINFQGGSFDAFRYTATVGGGESTVYGQFDRPLGFMESSISYKRFLSIYDSLQVDNPPGNSAVASPGWGLARDFMTFRVQPIERLSFDANYNYFRDVPTFATQLVGTSLLDKYLFQGWSFGVRGEVVRHVTLYTTLGESSRSGDAKNSMNQMYGITWDRIWRTGIRADVHYTRFNSSFGNGSYEALSLSRNLGERLHFEVLAGQQGFASGATANNSSRFLTAMADMNLGARYFVSGGLTFQRGVLMNYDQWFTMLGYRFDNRNTHHQ